MCKGVCFLLVACPLVYEGVMRLVIDFCLDRNKFVIYVEKLFCLFLDRWEANYGKFIQRRFYSVWTQIV